MGQAKGVSPILLEVQHYRTDPFDVSGIPMRRIGVICCILAHLVGWFFMLRPALSSGQGYADQGHVGMITCVVSLGILAYLTRTKRGHPDNK